MVDKILHDAENCIVLDKRDYEKAISRMKELNMKLEMYIKEHQKELKKLKNNKGGKK